MIRDRRLLFVLVAAAVLATPAPAFANVGIPMIVLALPGMAIMLIPVIALETYVLMRMLSISFWSSLRTTAAANAVSTLVGIPLTWVALALLEFLGSAALYSSGPLRGRDDLLQGILSVTMQAPWVPPGGGDWVVPTAMLVLLVPFFFASWLLEYRIGRVTLPSAPPASLKRAMFFTNLASYILLGLIVMVFLAGVLGQWWPVGT